MSYWLVRQLRTLVSDNHCPAKAMYSITPIVVRGCHPNSIRARGWGCQAIDEEAHRSLRGRHRLLGGDRPPSHRLSLAAVKIKSSKRPDVRRDQIVI